MAGLVDAMQSGAAAAGGGGRAARLMGARGEGDPDPVGRGGAGRERADRGRAKKARSRVLAALERLPALRSLGVTVLELMPIAAFPGRRNWGYDGVAPFAPQASYGGGFGLKRLVDAAHRLGLAVVLDVVYNHLGPDGNYLRAYTP